MDPLGAPSHFVDIETLPVWADFPEPEQSNSSPSPDENEQVDVQSPFPYRRDVNEKIILW